MKKVLVGIVTHEAKDYCLDEFLDSIRSLTYPKKDILFVDNSKTEEYANKIRTEGFHVNKDVWCVNALARIVTSYNKLRETFLKGDYDYLFTLEQDIFPPKDVIERLIAHNKDLVSGIYKINSIDGTVNCIWYKKKTFRNSKIKRIYLEDEKYNTGLIDWDGGFGTGCCIISRRVLEAIIFKQWEGTHDGVFCVEAHKMKFSLAVDTDIICRHLQSDWGLIIKEDLKDLEEIKNGNYRG